jgi:hypothetical protein
MMLPPTDPPPYGAGGPGEPAPGPDSDPDQVQPWLAELSEEELAGLVEPTEEELAGLVEPTDEELTVLDERLDAELARLWAEPDAARWDGGEDAGLGADLPGGPAGLVGGGFAEGGMLDRLGPGPALAGFSQGVLDGGLAGLSDDELVGVLRASRRLAAWQDGVEVAAVAELDARRARAAGRVSSAADEQVSSELAAALVLTGRSAGMLLGLARDLARLRSVRRELLAGTIDRARAVVFAAELAGLGDVAAAAAAAAFAAEAGSLTTGQLRAGLRALVLCLDPAAVRRRMERARGEARVEAWPESSGNAALAGRELPAADAIAADQRLTAIARALKDAGAPGTLDQLRAAVFAALLAGRDPQALLPPAPGQEPRTGGEPGAGRRGSGPGEPGGAGPGEARPGGAGLAGLAGSVQLIMPAAAWLGLSDAPGEAAGHGPLDAWTCRDLAARLAAGPGTRWSVTLTGPDGRAVAHAAARAGPGPPGGPDGYRAWLAGLRFDWLEQRACGHLRQERRYQPGNRLANLVRARQRRCSFPGCRRPAARSDLDPGRQDLRVQPSPFVSEASPGQASHRLEARTTPARRHGLAASPRPHLHSHTRALPGLIGCPGTKPSHLDRRSAVRLDTCGRSCLARRFGCWPDSQCRSRCLFSNGFSGGGKSGKVGPCA